MCEWQKTGDFSSLCGVARCSIVSLWNWFLGQKLWEMRDLKMWVETIEGVERIMGIKVIERQWRNGGKLLKWKLNARQEIEERKHNDGVIRVSWNLFYEINLCCFVPEWEMKFECVKRVICESVFLCFVFPINCQACPCSLPSYFHFPSTLLFVWLKTGLKTFLSLIVWMMKVKWDCVLMRWWFPHPHNNTWTMENKPFRLTWMNEGHDWTGTSQLSFPWGVGREKWRSVVMWDSWMREACVVWWGLWLWDCVQQPLRSEDV